jgi:SMP-30/Gluconolactonase/LRE-like region
MSRIIACIKITMLVCIGLAAVLTRTMPAAAFDRGDADILAILPAGATGPEGLVVAPNGEVYVATFGFNSSGPVTGAGKVYVYSEKGVLLRTLTVAGSTAHLLGLGIHPATHAFLVIDFGGAKVLNVDPHTGSATPFITLPPAFQAGSGLNALTFDSLGNIYVSDSFQGIIWKTGASGGVATAWVTSPLLTTTGVPPFGANGLGFNQAGNTLFVANTGNDTIVKIPVNGGTPGTPTVFVNSINGADGLIVDDHDNLWVCANQSDEIVVVDPTGKVMAKLGDFNGLTDDAVVRGFLFPASLYFSPDKRTLFVTNLALDLRLAVGPEAVTIDSPWAAQVKRYTVSRISTDLPRPGAVTQ